MNLIFQNKDFVAIDKFSGHLSVPGRFPDKDPRPVVGRDLESFLKQTIYPIHRLDCEVSGLILFALTAEAHREASQVFEKHQLQKTYQAITTKVTTDPLPTAGQKFTWKAQVQRGKKRSFISPHGKLSITEAEFVGPGIQEKTFHWNLKPITGRSHQLRFDLFRKGYPILGDVLYSGEKIREENKIFLRAIKIEFFQSEFVKKWNLPQQIEVKNLF